MRICFLPAPGYTTMGGCFANLSKFELRSLQLHLPSHISTRKNVEEAMTFDSINYLQLVVTRGLFSTGSDKGVNSLFGSTYIR